LDCTNTSIKVQHLKTANMVRLNLVFVSIAIAISLNIKAQDTIKQNKPLFYIGNSNYGIQPVFRVSSGIIWNRPVSRIDSIPATLRNIPAHPDDTYAKGLYNAGSSLKGVTLSDCISMSGGIKLKIKEINLTSIVSINLCYYEHHFTINSDGSGSSINRVNYSGSSAGSSGGAYVFMTSSYSVLNSGICEEIDFPVFHSHNDVCPRIVFGAGIRKFELFIRTGWDRWSALQTRESFDLATIYEKQIYSGINVPCYNTLTGTILDFNVKLGYSFCDSDLKPAFKSYNLSFKSGGLILGCSFKINIENLFHKYEKAG
jgi:hypothetical protein